ncbi:MAG: DUF2652 domain-containing protein [Chloroflexota bacterium]
MAENGYMIVADISGYTRFLSDSELDHAHEIIQSLINAMLKHIHSPITVARIEGDAIFAYTQSDNFLQGQTLLESLEHIYFTFARALESNDRNTTCTCNACANMDTLDLKMVVHHGEFMLQKLGSQTDLIGNDVNLTHRLLKNNIVEATGKPAYIFFTESAIKAMKMGEMVDLMEAHAEAYDHLGEVTGHVYDLSSVWKRERERHRIYVTPDQASISVEFEVPVPPMVAWDYINDPEARAKYRFSDVAKVVRGNKGRIEEGAVYHCVHGEVKVHETIVDWKPFEYVTVESFNKAWNVVSNVRISIHISPSDTGSNIAVLMRAPVAENKIKQKIVDQLWKTSMRTFYKTNAGLIPDAINGMIAEDKDSGRLNMRMIAAAG